MPGCSKNKKKESLRVVGGGSLPLRSIVLASLRSIALPPQRGTSPRNAPGTKKRVPTLPLVPPSEGFLLQQNFHHPQERPSQQNQPQACGSCSKWIPHRQT